DDDPDGDSDAFSISSEGNMTSNFPTGVYKLDGFSMGMVDDTRTAFSSDHLPTSYVSTALFDGAQFGIGFTGPGAPSTGAGLVGTLKSPPTPIPAALPLFATALGGLGIVGWRRRKNSRLAMRSVV